MKRKHQSVPRRAVRRMMKKWTFNSADILEQRVLLSATGVEPIGGTGNNVAHPTWGTAGNNLIRLTPAQYANGYSTPSLPNDPSARLMPNSPNWPICCADRMEAAPLEPVRCAQGGPSRGERWLGPP